MGYLKYLALLSTLILVFPLAALARDKNQHTVDLPDTVQVGATQLKAGTYKVQWQGSGSAVQVTFRQNGKTVATLPATLKANDGEASQDAIITDTTTSASAKLLKEIDFGHQKEALVFEQNQGGM
jgi:hypothetical protein